MFVWVEERNNRTLPCGHLRGLHAGSEVRAFTSSSYGNVGDKMINPRQLITRLTVIVERRINLNAEFVPALEARDIQAGINRMFEELIAEQQPSVKAGK